MRKLTQYSLLSSLFPTKSIYKEIKREITTNLEGSRMKGNGIGREGR